MSEVQQKVNRSKVSAPKPQLAAEGWCLVLTLLSDATCAEILDQLEVATKKSAQSGIPNFLPNLDPNVSNVREFNLLEWNNVFCELIRNPTALEFGKTTLGPNYLISNFTANIARPGSGSMGDTVRLNQLESALRCL